MAKAGPFAQWGSHASLRGKLRFYAVFALAFAIYGCSSQRGGDEPPKEHAGAAKVALLPGVVAAYGFEETSGTTASDASGNGNTGTLDGQNWASGRFGGALQFASNMVTVADSNVLNLQSAMTLSAWVKPSTLHDNWPTILMKEGTGAFGYALFGEFWDEFDDRRPPSSTLESSGELYSVVGGAFRPNGTWTHLASTYDGADFRFYVDGELVHSIPLDVEVAVTAGPLRIGGNAVYANEFFYGLIDELRVYDRALSSQEIEFDMYTAVRDTSPAAIALVEPEDGAAVSGNVTAKVFVRDPAAVRVQFLVDGIPTGAEDTATPFEQVLDTTVLLNGPHTLGAEAKNSSGTLLATSTTNIVVNNGLVAAYGFDEGSGATASDSSGHGHQAILAGQDWVNGKFGSALQFTDSFVTVADSALLDLQAMTLSAWVKPLDTQDPLVTILMKEGDAEITEEFSYSLFGEWTDEFDDTHPPSGFVVSESTYYSVSGGAFAPIGEWTHLASTYDGAELRFYVDGVLLDSRPLDVDVVTTEGALRIGGNALDPLQFFRGAIDEVRIYNRALSQTEIQAAMQGPLDCSTAVDDGNLCTIDACNSSGVPTHTPLPNGTNCTDDNLCTTADSCQSGTCVGSGSVTCVALDGCHDAGTCDPTTGLCSDPPTVDGIPCPNATVCDGTETCQSGVCVAGTPLALDDGNPCTADSCDPSAGTTHIPVSAGTSCSNGNACDGAEACNENGACLAGDPPSLEDGNPCTVDVCDAAMGVSHLPREAGTVCSDASCQDDFETGPGACDGFGSCVPGPTGGCAPYVCGTNTCLSSCLSDEDCSGTATCAGGVCLAGPSDPCAEDLECSTGACVNGLCCDQNVSSYPFGAVAFDPTIATDFASQAAPLYSGSSPTQSPITPGAVNPERVAIVRGRVLGLDGTPIGCVAVSVVGAAEIGMTRTRSDGSYAIAVNGGGRVVVRVALEGYVTAFRQVEPANHTFAVAEDIRLVPHGPSAQVSAAATDITTVAGELETDATGTRRATLLFDPGTHALVEGEASPRDNYAVRVKEVTNLGATHDAMPAELPPTSAFTYAVSLSLAGVEGARVSFNKPIAVYVEDFIGFPNGEEVPVGYFDETTGTWASSDNGRVLRIVSRNAAGEAQLDIDTTVGIDDPSSLGIDSAERMRLAAIYPDGTALWRFVVDHFSTWDANWGWGPDPNSEPPNQPDPNHDPDPDCDGQKVGSIIRCESQSLGEGVPIASTPFELAYWSTRQPGGGPSLEIPVASSPLPAGLRSIELKVDIAGRRFTTTYGVPQSPTLPLRHSFRWDGLDAFGRRVHGPQRVQTALGYTYGGSYQRTSRFGYNGNGVSITGSRDRFEATLWQRWGGWYQQWDARSAGLGGWSLNVHHAYDPKSLKVYLGDGGLIDISELTPRLVTIAGNGTIGFSGDGGPAINAQLNLDGSFSNSSIAVAQDGTVYFSDARNHRVRKIATDGVITTVAGGGSATVVPFGDGGPATNATFDTPTGIAIDLDGAILVCDKYHNRIRRIDHSGIITTVAGTGNQNFNGDGPALTRNLDQPTGLAVGTDGTIYFTDNKPRRMRDGFVSVIPIVPWTYLTQPAAGKDGSIFFSNYGANRVQRVGVDGVFTNYAGNGSSGSFPFGEGGPAGAASISQPDGLTVGPDGLVYIADTSHYMVRRVKGDGSIETLIGTGTGGYDGENLPATRSKISRARGLTVGPDGTIYLVDTDNHRIRKTSVPVAAPNSGGSLSVASSDGRNVFVFSGEGRHQKTLDAYTGFTIFAFEYDNEGRLAGISDRALIDPNRRMTVIERDSSGRATAIVAPDGQRTVLSIDAADNLRSVTNPAGGIHSFDYAAGGLLVRMRDPKGNAEGTAAYEFEYADGRLLRDEDPFDHSQTLARSSLLQAERVTHMTPLGRVTTYDTRLTNPLLLDRSTTGPDGLVTQRLSRRDGKPSFPGPNGKSYSSKHSRSDGSIVFLQLDPDPLFGQQAPVESERLEVMGTGGGALSRRTQRTRSIVRAIVGDPSSVVQSTETVVVNGKTTTTTFDAASRTFTTTSPAGRHTFRTIDPHGRAVMTQVEGILPMEFQYDQAGRMLQAVQGDRTTHFSYVQSADATNGYLESVTNAVNQTTTYVPDELGQVLAETLGGTTTSLGYDPNGNLAMVTPPEGPAHGQAFTALNQLSSYAPPPAGLSVANTIYTHNADRDLLTVTRPDGVTLSHTYDTAGRLDAVGFGSNLLDYEYYGNASGTGIAPGRLSAIRGPYGIDVTLGYLGRLTTVTAWTGLVQGRISWSYDADFRPLTETVNGVTGSSQAQFGYDPDGLIICASPTSCAPPSSSALRLSRHPQHGLVTAITLGATSESLAYNGYGEMAHQAATFSSAPLVDITYDNASTPRDPLGRVVKKSETIAGTTRVFEYQYDPQRRLADVTLDGVLAEHFTYDGNGNRLTGWSSATGTRTGIYDDQDRLLSYGPWEFTYTANGELDTKTNTITSEVWAFQYDSLGNLLSVLLPDGRLIEYLVDGLGRRVGKKVNGIVVKRWLYRDATRPAAELDGSGALVAQFVYGSKLNVPDYVRRGGSTFRVISDHLGSPRYVVNVGNAADLPFTATYTSFGEVTGIGLDWMPFGFAGGIYDGDTGLVRFGARDYDPVVGRWTSKEPLRFAGGSNFYVYSLNDPINIQDPSGLAPEGAGGASGEGGCEGAGGGPSPPNPGGDKASQYSMASMVLCRAAASLICDRICGIVGKTPQGRTGCFAACMGLGGICPPVPEPPGECDPDDPECA